MSQSLFVFKVASEEGEPDWLNVGELDPGRIGGPRGCCAETLVFVQSLMRVGYLERFYRRGMKDLSCHDFRDML